MAQTQTGRFFDGAQVDLGLIPIEASVLNIEPVTVTVAVEVPAVGMSMALTATTVTVPVEVPTATVSTQIRATLLTSAYDNVDRTAYTTASIAPAADSMLLLFVTDSIGIGSAPESVPTGLGLTWERLGRRAWSASPGIRHSGAWIAQCGATAPTPGVITLTENDMGSGTTSSGTAWVVIQVEGHHATQPVRQVQHPGSTTPTIDGFLDSSLDLPMLPAVDANSRGFSYFAHVANEGTTFRTNWSELSDDFGASPIMASEAQWRSDAFETTASASWATGSRYMGFAIEIADRSAPDIARATIASYAETSGVLAASVTVNMPTDIDAGDLLIAYVSADANSTIAPGGGEGWTSIDDASNGSDVRLTILAKLAAGGDALTLTVGAAADTATYVQRITHHGVSNVATDIVVGAAATGTDANPDPPSVTPPSNKTWLVLACAAADDDDNLAFLTYHPTGYVPLAQTESSATTTSCMLDVACDVQTTGSAINPGTFTMAAAEEWVAQTLFVPGFSADTNITPATVTIPVEIPSATITATADITATTVTVAVEVPAVTVTSSPTITPAPVVVAVEVPTATVTASTSITPSPVTVAVEIPSVTVAVAIPVNATTVDVVVEIPTATVTSAIPIDATPVVVAVEIPTAAVTTTAAITASPVVVAVEVPTAAVTASATITATPVDVVVEVPVATVTAATVVAATTVTVAVEVPTATVQTTAAITATPVDVVVEIPAATITASATITATPVLITVEIPTAEPTTDTLILATTVTIPVEVPTAAVTASAAINPSPVVVAVDVPTPAVTTTAEITAATVTIPVEIPPAAVHIAVNAQPVDVAVEVPVATVTATAAITATPVVVVVEVPTASPTATADINATTVTIPVEVPTATVDVPVNATVNASTVLIEVDVPTPTIGATSTITPNPVTVLVELPIATIIAIDAVVAGLILTLTPTDGSVTGCTTTGIVTGQGSTSVIVGTGANTILQLPTTTATILGAHT
jgi:hypothetical protein